MCSRLMMMTMNLLIVLLPLSTNEWEIDSYLKILILLMTWVSSPITIIIVVIMTIGDEISRNDSTYSSQQK